MADSFATPEPISVPKATAEFLALTEGVVAPDLGSQLSLLVVDSDEQVRHTCRTVGSDTGMKLVDVGATWQGQGFGGFSCIAHSIRETQACCTKRSFSARAAPPGG